jgi:hypothetical protein
MTKINTSAGFNIEEKPKHLIELPTITPNAGIIENPAKRKVIGNVLYGISLSTGIAGIIAFAYPNIAGEFDIPKLISVINACVSLVAGGYGFAVTSPNIPKKKEY